MHCTLLRGDAALSRCDDRIDLLARGVGTSHRRREFDGRSGSLDDCLYAVPWLRHSASLHEMLALEQRHVPSHRRRIP